jgi:hypothetical protein
MNDTTELADYSILREAFIAKWEAEGLVITYPADNELQIDIDSAEDMARHEKSWTCLVRNIDREAGSLCLTEDCRRITTSRSGTGKHVRIMLPFPLTPLERIAFQAAMGSDAVRELLSIFRLRMGDQNPTLLVETPEVAATLKTAA